MSDPVLNRHAPRQIPVSRPWITELEREAVQRTMLSGWLSSGPVVESFEQEIAVSHGANHGIACNSGTTALMLALRAAGVRAGSIVLLPTMTMIAVANAVLYLGGRPVFVDSSPQDGNPAGPEVARYAPLAHLAIVPHLYGVVAREAVRAAREASGGLWIVQDCAEAHYADIPPPDQLTMLTFSFYANKIVTCGEGGMVTTQDPEVAERLRGLRAHAFTPGDHFTHQELAYGCRLTDLQASVGLAQHVRRQEILRERARVAAQYRAALRGLDWLRPLASDEPEESRSWWVYPVVIENTKHGRDLTSVRAALAQAGIETRRFFRPLHTQPHLREFARPHQRFPVSLDLYGRGLYLPLYPEMDQHDIQHVTDVLWRV